MHTFLYGEDKAGPWVTKIGIETLNEYIKPIIHDGLNAQGLENLNAYLYGDEMAAFHLKFQNMDAECIKNHERIRISDEGFYSPAQNTICRKLSLVHRCILCYIKYVSLILWLILLDFTCCLGLYSQWIIVPLSGLRWLFYLRPHCTEIGRAHV